MPAYKQAVKPSPLAIAQVPEVIDDRRRGACWLIKIAK